MTRTNNYNISINSQNIRAIRVIRAIRGSKVSIANKNNTTRLPLYNIVIH